MTEKWRKHGSEFPALLFIAGYSIVGARFTRMPKLDDFAKGTKEIDGFDVWQALHNLYIWLNTKCEDFSFGRKNIFLEPRDIDVPEVATCLLEMTMLCIEGNLPAELRHEASHYGQCEYHLGCYTDTLRAFLSHLYFGIDFDKTALGRQMQFATELQRFFEELAALVSSVPAIELINHFVATLEPAVRTNFRSFLQKKMLSVGNLDEDLVHQWIEEFRKEAGIHLN